MFELITGDAEQSLARLPDGYVDMTLTSPPYDDLRSYEGKEISINWDGIAEQLYRVTKDGGVVIWVVGPRSINGSESLAPFHQAESFIYFGWSLHDTMIFAKKNPMPGNCGQRYKQAFDYMFCFSKGTPKAFNPITEPTKAAGKVFPSFRATEEGRDYTPAEGERVVKGEKKVGNIFFYTVGAASTKDKIAFEHPAIFPEKLAEDQIRTWSNEGDRVLDCFSGSGTTGKVALSMGRDYTGIELYQKYNEIARKRMCNCE
jgi:site-specific DNA-methyltransferase (adenine-specific)